MGFSHGNNDQKIRQQTVLLGRFNGTANSKVFADKDRSIYNKGMTANGSAHFSATQSKFGGTSLYLAGTGGTTDLLGNRDLLNLNDHVDWFLGTGSFTIDWWGYQPNTTNAVVFGQYTNGTNWWGVICSPVPNTSSAAVTIGGLNAGSWDVNIYATSSTTGSPTNTWNHYAVVRVDSGNTSASWRIFINGVSKTLNLAVGSWNGTLRNYSGKAYVGSLMGNFAGDYTGYISELRVTKGQALWTSDFTPPTRPYGEGENNVPS